MNTEDVTVTITVSRAAYEKAAKLANDKNGPAGELAGLLSADEYIERLVEIVLED